MDTVPGELSNKQYEYIVKHFGMAGDVRSSGIEKLQLFDTDFPVLYPIVGYGVGNDTKRIKGDEYVKYHNEATDIDGILLTARYGDRGDKLVYDNKNHMN